MEIITIKLPKDIFNTMLLNGVFKQYKVTPEIKNINIEDGLLDNDSIAADLETAAITAYSKLYEYRKNKRLKVK